MATRFRDVKADVHGQLVSVLDLSRVGDWEDERLRKEVRGVAEKLVATRAKELSADQQTRLIEELMSEVFGLGPLDPLMADATVNDILVNGPKNVYVDRAGVLEHTDVHFHDNAHLTQIIQRVVGRIGRRVDEMTPMVDARLPDGSRVHAILPPLSLEGPVLSIRRFDTHLGPEELLNHGSLTPEILQLLAAAVQGRINLMLSGGTGAGKTTLLNILSAFIPTSERLVTIEDAAELQLRQPHVIRLETRPANLEGRNEVNQRELVRNSLRMRPDRILVGEVRGPEALDMLQAMNTGHEGSMTTVHANDTRDALARLELMVTLAGYEMPMMVVRNYTATALHLLVHVARLQGGQRKVVRVSELVGLRKNGRYAVRDLFVFRQTGIYNGRAVGGFHATGKKPAFLERLKVAGITLPDDLFTERELAMRPAVTPTPHMEGQVDEPDYLSD